MKVSVSTKVSSFTVVLCSAEFDNEFPGSKDVITITEVFYTIEEAQEFVREMHEGPFKILTCLIFKDHKECKDVDLSDTHLS